MFKTNQPSRRYRPGFTLVELLIVIGIIVVLISILLPAVHGARQQAKMVLCRNNLRQIGVAATNYAMSNNGAYPATTQFGGHWMTDVADETVAKLTAFGATKEQFYCPIWRDHEVEEIDTLWKFEWTYRLTGYFFMIRRDKMSAMALNPPKTAKARVSDSDGNPDDTELAGDATMNYSSLSQRFYDIYRDYDHNHGGGVTLTTNHLRGTTPEGGNVLFMDGHVDWRGFSEMQVRTAVWGVQQWY